VEEMFAKKDAKLKIKVWFINRLNQNVDINYVLVFVCEVL